MIEENNEIKTLKFYSDGTDLNHAEQLSLQDKLPLLSAIK